MPSFEKRLLNLVSGDNKTFTIPAKEAFGESDDRSIYQIPKEKFNDK